MPSTDDTTETMTADDESFLATFDPDTGEPASVTVVTAVASLSGVGPLELEPLYEAVDPDALDALVRHTHRVEDTGTHELWFSYEGYDVGVRSDGRVEIHDGTAPANA
ncbi:HalOD1 output domain-containing protein [Natronolimnohabitans innermongolicus]|nr:HalOD1 output domain-containing protein [Natronolimnohabitans innermongolicus]